MCCAAVWVQQRDSSPVVSTSAEPSQLTGTMFLFLSEAEASADVTGSGARIVLRQLDLFVVAASHPLTMFGEYTEVFTNKQSVTHTLPLSPLALRSASGAFISAVQKCLFRHIEE